MISDKRREFCTGCRSFENYSYVHTVNTYCKYFLIRYIGCPCNLCLIKSMCTTACYKLTRFKYGYEDYK